MTAFIPAKPFKLVDPRVASRGLFNPPSHAPHSPDLCLGRGVVSCRTASEEHNARYHYCVPLETSPSYARAYR